MTCGVRCAAGRRPQHPPRPPHPLPRSSQRAEWPARACTCVLLYVCYCICDNVRTRACTRACTCACTCMPTRACACGAHGPPCASAGALRACLAAAASSRVCPSFLVGAVRLMQSGSCVCARERARRVRTRGGGQDSTSASRGRLVLLRSQKCSGPRRTAGAPVSALVHACAHGCARVAPTTYLPSQARSPERRCRAQTSPTAHAEGVHIYILRARQTVSVRQRVPQRAVRGPHNQAHCVRGAAHADGKRWRARSESGRAPGVGAGAQLTVAWRTMGVLRKNELGGLSLCAASAAAPAVAPTAAAADAPARTLQEMHSSRYEGELQPMLLRRAAAQRAARGPRGAARSARAVARARARTNSGLCEAANTGESGAPLAASARSRPARQGIETHSRASPGPERWTNIADALTGHGGLDASHAHTPNTRPWRAPCATTPSLDDGGRLGDVHDVAVSGRARLRRCVAVAI